MNSGECQTLRKILENSSTDLSDYGIKSSFLTEKKDYFTFEEVEVSLELMEGVKIELKTKLKSRKSWCVCLCLGS